MAARRILASLIVAAVTLALGAGSAVAGGPVTYTGTVAIDNSNDGKNDPVPMALSISIQGHRITGYQFPASLRCTDGSFSNLGVNYAQQSSSPIAFRGHHFAVTVGNPSTGSGLTAVITGTVVPGRHVIGHILVNAHADEGVTPSGPACTAAYHWIARAQQPATPPRSTPPSGTAPSVELSLVPVRLPLTASAYQYGIAVSNVACSGGAEAFSVSAGGHSATLTCAATVPHPLTNAFFGLDAGSSYEVTVQPLVQGTGGLVAKGTALRREVAIPLAGSPKWRPIAGA